MSPDSFFRRTRVDGNSTATRSTGSPVRPERAGQLHVPGWYATCVLSRVGALIEVSQRRHERGLGLTVISTRSGGVS